MAAVSVHRREAVLAQESYVHGEHVAAPGAPLLFLFHGTGADESQFFDLGRQMVPAVGLVAPRGDVSERGAARFFRREAEGLYDMADLSRAREKMAAFVASKIAERRPSRVLGLGYSNGANILATVLLEDLSLFDAAVLMHPLIPFVPEPNRMMADCDILITAGRNDPISPAPLTERLAGEFRRRGASVETIWHPGGHDIRQVEVDGAARFLARAASIEEGVRA